MKREYTPIQTHKTLANDAISCLDLLNETMRKKVTLTFVNANRGHARLSTQHITIPRHAFGRGETYLLYYVIHEFTHIYTSDCRHDAKFKNAEKRLLAMFGYEIEYARAYPKTLYANGEKAYSYK